MNTIDAILARRSVRQYSDVVVSDSDIEQILKAGKHAASGMNRKVWHFVVLQNTELLAELEATVGEAKGKTNPFFEVKTVILVWVDTTVSTTPIEDGSLALGNMMLAATELGIGTCWVNANKMYKDDKYNDFKDKIRPKENYDLIGTITVGYPKDGVFPKASAQKDDVVTFMR